MGDGMTKKHHLLLYSLLGVCLVIAVGFAIAAQRGKRQYARALEDAYRGTLLSSMTQMEQLRLNIDKAMLSQDEGQSAALISRIGSDAAAVQSGLSALPLSHIAMADAVKLCNQLSDYAAALLSQADAALTAEDAQLLEQLSHACAQLQQALQSAYGQMQTGSTAIAQFNRYMQDADAAVRPLEGVSKDIDYPTLIYDGPFSDVVSGGAPRGLGAQAVDSAQALACARDFLGDCGQDVALTQESGGTIPAWGVRAQGAAGVLQLAVTKQGGNVLWMFPESAQYEPSYGLEDCKQAAQAFFSAHGYGDMALTFWQVYAGMATLSYAAVQDGVILYPDLIKVQVRMDTLAIVGLEARRYLSSHTQRSSLTPAVSQEEAQGAVSERLNVRQARLCVIPQNSRELLCWEFTGDYNGDTYYVYIDAQTGRQADIPKLVQSASGPMSE